MKTIRIKLDQKQRAAFVRLRQQLSLLTGKCNRSDAAYAALLHEQETVEAAIGKLENSALNDKQSLAIAAKRERLASIQRRISQAENSTADEDTIAALMDLLRQFRPLLQSALGKVQKEIQRRIFAALTPFFPDDIIPNYFPDSPHIRAVQNFGQRAFGFITENPASQARDAIKIIDQLLAGENPVKFNV